MAISHDHAARAPFPVTAVIHHGVRPEDFPVGSGAGDYLLFLGRFSADKGAREAALIAHAAGGAADHGREEAGSGRNRLPAADAGRMSVVPPWEAHREVFLGEGDRDSRCASGGSGPGLMALG